MELDTEGEDALDTVLSRDRLAVVEPVLSTIRTPPFHVIGSGRIHHRSTGEWTRSRRSIPRCL